jgi:hypothetical protein
MNHTEAQGIVDALGVTPAESLFLRGVAWHETNYGTGWRKGAGAGSFNMGAITTTHPDSLSFEHKDSLFDSKLGHVREYVTWFAGYPSASAGFGALRRIVLKPNVVAALADNDFRAAVQGMYNNSYFMGLHSHKTDEGNAQNVDDYYGAVQRAVQLIGNETGESEPVPLEGSEGKSWDQKATGGGLLLVGVAAAAGLAWMLMKGKRS